MKNTYRAVQVSKPGVLEVVECELQSPRNPTPTRWPIAAAANLFVGATS